VTRGTLKVNRSRLPEPGDSRRFSFPSIEKSTLDNGLRVWTVRHTAVPLVAVTLLLPSGSASDPPGSEGLAAIALDMLDEGSGGLSAIDMHEALARLGTRLDSDIGPDSMVLSFTSLSRVVESALGILADMAVRPSLLDDDFGRVRDLRVHRLKQLRDVPGAVADRAFVRLLYGMHPYGHTPLGNERSLSELTVDDVRSFHRAIIRSGDATLFAVGDCDHDSIRRAASVAFAGWSGAPGRDVTPPAGLPTPPRVNIVARPGASQSEVRIGHVAAARRTPDYHALVVANAVLGGLFVSRINLNLREDKGLTYGVFTGFDFRRWPGPFAMYGSVDTAGTARAIQESLAEMTAIRGPRPPTPDELSLAVAGLTRGYARNFETAEQIARALMQLALYDLPDDYYVEFVPRIERVTSDEVARVAARHLDPARLTTLVVGDVDRIRADLANLGLGEPEVVAPESF
jgi:zinc protease